MTRDELTVVDPDGVPIVVHRWLPDRGAGAVLHILHGWGEHGLRYDRPARAFVERPGIAVYADDHRGHGQTGVRNESVGDLGPRGGDGVLDAVRAVSERAMAEHPGVPFFVLGQSWGSFLLQAYLRRWAAAGVVGAILTGTTRRDPDAPRRAGGLNEAFEPARTAYDWLSRDEAEVDAYIADPLCGFEVMRGTPASSIAAVGTDADIPTTLPILVLNGSDDPIGGHAGGERLANHHRSLGIEDVTFLSYAGARHELFNETCRDEVVADVLSWLEARITNWRQ